jgi:cell division transport system ATP-binding protein
MEMLGLFRKDGCFPRQLSDGEKQKVACARAMVKEPVLLLADEPTLNLDDKSSEEIMKLLQQINILGTSVLLSTCDPHLMVGDHVRRIMLDRGKMIEPIWESIKIPSPV